MQTLQPLPLGAEVFLLVHTVERENGTTLYGFSEQSELDAFEALIKVPSVGPSVALALLATLGVPGLAAAVVSRDASALGTVPGIGPKKAATLAATVQLPDHLCRTAGTVAEEDGLAADLAAMGFAPGDVAAALVQARADLPHVEPGDDQVLFAALRLLRESALAGKVSDGV